MFRSPWKSKSICYFCRCNVSIKIGHYPLLQYLDDNKSFPKFEPDDSWLTYLVHTSICSKYQRFSCIDCCWYSARICTVSLPQQTGSLFQRRWQVRVSHVKPDDTTWIPQHIMCLYFLHFFSFLLTYFSCRT